MRLDRSTRSPDRASRRRSGIGAPSLYEPRWVPRVLRNWRALEGQLRIKAGLVLYLLAPVAKPRRPQGSREMPLLVATRAG